MVYPPVLSEVGIGKGKNQVIFPFHSLGAKEMYEMRALFGICTELVEDANFLFEFVLVRRKQPFNCHEALFSLYHTRQLLLPLRTNDSCTSDSESSQKRWCAG